MSSGLTWPVRGNTRFEIFEGFLEFGEGAVFVGVRNCFHSINVTTLIFLSHFASNDIYVKNIQGGVL